MRNRKPEGQPTRTNELRMASSGRLLWLSLLLLTGTCPINLCAAASNSIAVVVAQGNVEVSRVTNSLWKPAGTTYPEHVLVPGDALRTGERSRAAVRLSNLTVKQMGANSHLAVLPPREQRSSFQLFRGIFSFFHRDDPAEFDLESPVVSMTIRGTEFQVTVNPQDGTTTVQLFDGAVEMVNAFGSLRLEGRSAGRVVPGSRPERTAVLEMNEALQWCLYYPGVLDIDDLPVSVLQSAALGPSLLAYRDGDLLAALTAYPPGRSPETSAERIYLAGLLLSVGDVVEADTILSVSTNASDTASVEYRLRRSLTRWMSLQRGVSDPVAGEPQNATEWLVESYARQLGWQRSHAADAATADPKGEQSRGEGLTRALEAARECVRLSPRFGLGWTRVAELEFSFGRRSEAQDALKRALQLSPRNAQAHALNGFVLSAAGQYRQALDAFERAKAIDEHLGNAWLGRGLCRIRLGDATDGRLDLEVAAALEPGRALLRSYLGKAWANAGEANRAYEELRRAQELDPLDPTAWLYSSLLFEQANRLNQAARDLQRSQSLNDQRRLYRSNFLLDQDRAVRGANLARIYQDVGFSEIAFREASQAVASDYANYSAHLFLANSYEGLRNRNRIDLRYETPAISEFLLSVLLAPVGAGVLSSYVSQHEYSKLFERQQLGLTASTDYASHGSWTHQVAQYGHDSHSSYVVEGAYRSDPGFRPNQDLRLRETAVRFKQELTPQDSVYFDARYADSVSGDLADYRDPRQANPGLRVRETQEPLLLAGYHREWSPQSRTLILAGRFDDRNEVLNPYQPTTVLQKNAQGQVVDALPMTIAQDYRGSFVTYSTEIQHLLQWQSHTFALGGRVQHGDFDTRNVQRDPSALGFLFPGSDPPIAQNESVGMDRLTMYAYDYAHVLEELTLIGGLSYDTLEFPENHRFAPISPTEDERHRLSPKAGLVWIPTDQTSFRGAYTRSLGGVSFDQSFQLEPTQIAGFTQSFRSLMPESLVGANSGADFETAGLEWDQKIGQSTFVVVRGEWLRSGVDRTRGVFDLLDSGPPLVVSGTPEELRFSEKAFSASAYRLLGESWSIGGTYRLSRAELEDRFPAIPESVSSDFVSLSRYSGLMHQVGLFARVNHSSGLFGIAEMNWFDQAIGATTNEDILQANFLVGYRFYRRLAEVRLGILNVTGRDHRLDPLNSVSFVPRERMVTLGFRLSL